MRSGALPGPALEGRCLLVPAAGDVLRARASMNGQPKVSVFLSSPADVIPEREAAEWVVQRLNGVYTAHVELAAKRLGAALLRGRSKGSRKRLRPWRPSISSSASCGSALAASCRPRGLAVR